jgi:holo-[acyl-carrier protein] synthase
MLFGIGTDIVEIARIEKASEASIRFAKRILTDFELIEFQASKTPARYLAKKFAAKEALVKALGTGIGNGYSWQMAQIEHNDLGKPFFVFFDAMQTFMDEHDIINCQLSISDEQAYATAMVVLEAAN